MERPALLEAALRAIRDTSIRLETSPGRQPIPVFWIVGPSGAGKSVLLLQVMRELVLCGDVEAANYLGELAHTLPRSLDYWLVSPERALIVVDDLFAPENRDPEIWRAVAESAFTSTWQRSWILTCGPTEQLRAFGNEVYRHPELQLVEIRIDPMNSDEQSTYHAWYVQRTAVPVQITKEPIIIAATWIYELRRQADLSPESFSMRFYTRLRELGLQDPGRAALSLNQYGLKAPGALFAGREAELDRLTSEQIYRLAHPAPGVRQGRFFHSRIAKMIYEVIVPETELRRRAEDLARGFAAMLDEGDPADAFFTWLNAPRTQSLLKLPLKKETLVAMWPAFLQRGLREDVVPRLKRWHAITHASGVNVGPIGAARQIRDWFHATPEDALHWGLLFQMVWEDADDTERDALYARGEAWLEDHFDSGSWNWIWQLLQTYRPNRTELIDLGFLWLYDNQAHPGWSRVWQRIHDSGVREPDLLQNALDALPYQPESPADIPVWQKIESLKPSNADFLGAIVRKLARVRVPYFMGKGVDFVLERIGESPVARLLSPAITDSMSEASWPHLWLALVSNRPEECELIELGRDWLAGREDRPEWNYVWQRLVELDFETERLLPIGRDWLAGREDRDEYTHVHRMIYGRWPNR